jgi:hypothetical protein
MPRQFTLGKHMNKLVAGEPIYVVQHDDGWLDGGDSGDGRVQAGAVKLGARVGIVVHVKDGVAIVGTVAAA